MTHGSLFAGIGGFDLGFSWAGIETLWQVEIDGYCRQVLERHFPEAQRFADVGECGKDNLTPVDIISGGFPCQDISIAGKQEGIDGERSGLWSEFHRIIGELRPRYVVIENVAALVNAGFDTVLVDLAKIGYDAEWQIISANDVGAPHLRNRIWIVAYPDQMGRKVHKQSIPRRSLSWDRLETMARIWNKTVPEYLRMDDGLPEKLDKTRIAHCGNAVVPQIPYIIGQYILQTEGEL